MLVSAVAVQALPAPRVVPYVVLFTLFAIAFVGALLMPEPVTTRSRPRLTLQRPSVPPVVRRPFLLAGLGVLSSWSIGGLFFSLGPQLSAVVFHTDNHIVDRNSASSCSPARPRSRRSCSAAAPRGSPRRPARSRSPRACC